MESMCRSVDSFEVGVITVFVVGTVGHFHFFSRFFGTDSWCCGSGRFACCCGLCGIPSVEGSMVDSFIFVWKVAAGDLLRPGIWSELEDASDKEWSCGNN